MNRDDESVIRQAPSPDRVTVSASPSDGTEGGAKSPGESAPTRRDAERTISHPNYGAPMATANDVIADIEINRPGLSVTKRNLLLFFCQGHHLGDLDIPLFDDPIYASATGVDVLPDAATPVKLGNGRLNTIGYVLSRYASLSPADLRTLVQASTPWQLARKTGDNLIDPARMREWFRRDDERNDPEDDRPTADMIAEFRAKYGRPIPPTDLGEPEDPDDFRALAAQLRGESG